MMNWKSIEELNNKYSVSDCGSVKNNSTNKILKQTKSKTGYHTICFNLNGKYLCKKVHRLVAIYFVDNPENKPFVNHIDCNKSNNDFKNLEWVTCQENMDHAKVNNLMKSGEDNKSSKLSLDKINEIKNLYLKGLSYREIAKLYCVHYTTIGKIIKGKSWL